MYATSGKTIGPRTLSASRAGRLHDAASHGRLSADELDHRLGAVYSARTRRKLASQLGDLAGATRAGEPRRVNGLSVTFVNSSCRGTRAHVGWWE